MPRKAPLPDAEKAIGRRLREAREKRLIPQTGMAGALQISRAQLINYEEGISPLPWYVAIRLLRKFEVNPRWLATGKLPDRLDADAHLPQADPDTYPLRGKSFTRVYADLWRHTVEDATMMMLAMAGRGKEKEPRRFLWKKVVFDQAANAWLQRVPKDREREFLLELGAEAERIISRMKAADASPE